MAHCRTSCGEIPFRKAAGREWQLLAAFCLLRIPIFDHSDVRFLAQNGHYVVSANEKDDEALLAATGHDFVSTINGRSEGTREL